jgi:hypothetical protein
VDLYVTAGFEPGRQRLAGPLRTSSISAPAVGDNLPGFFRCAAWTAALTCASLHRHRRRTTCSAWAHEFWWTADPGSDGTEPVSGS